MFETQLQESYYLQICSFYKNTPHCTEAYRSTKYYIYSYVMNKYVFFIILIITIISHNRAGSECEFKNSRYN